MSKLIQLACQIDGITSKKDKTLSIKIGTQEMNADDMAELFDMFQQQIWVAFCKTSIKVEDLEVPDDLPPVKGEKSESQRMRAIIYRLWELTDKSKPLGVSCLSRSIYSSISFSFSISCDISFLFNI